MSEPPKVEQNHQVRWAVAAYCSLTRSNDNRNLGGFGLHDHRDKVERKGYIVVEVNPDDSSQALSC